MLKFRVQYTLDANMSIANAIACKFYIPIVLV